VTKLSLLPVVSSRVERLLSTCKKVRRPWAVRTSRRAQKKWELSIGLFSILNGFSILAMAHAHVMCNRGMPLGRWYVDLGLHSKTIPAAERFYRRRAGCLLVVAHFVRAVKLNLAVALSRPARKSIGPDDTATFKIQTQGRKKANLCPTSISLFVADLFVSRSPLSALERLDKLLATQPGQNKTRGDRVALRTSRSTGWYDFFTRTCWERFCFSNGCVSQKYQPHSSLLKCKDGCCQLSTCGSEARTRPSSRSQEGQIRFT
jgi:hypothetical protein